MQLIKAKALDYRRFTQYRIAILFHCGGLILILWGVRHDCSSAYPYERRKPPFFRRGRSAGVMGRTLGSCGLLTPPFIESAT